MNYQLSGTVSGAQGKSVSHNKKICFHGVYIPVEKLKTSITNKVFGVVSGEC